MNECGRSLYLHDLPMEIACTALEEDEVTITFDYGKAHEHTGNGTENEAITFIESEVEDEDLEPYEDSLDEVMRSDYDEAEPKLEKNQDIEESKLNSNDELSFYPSLFLILLLWLIN